MKKIISLLLLSIAILSPNLAQAKVAARPYISTEKNQVGVAQEVKLYSYNSFLAGKSASSYTYKWAVASAPTGYTGETKASGLGLTEFNFTPNAIGNYIIELKLVDSSGAVSIPHYLTLTTISFNAMFSDLPVKYWARNYFYDLFYAGVIRGYDDGTLRPEAKINRAEFLTLCMRAFAKANGKNLEEIYPKQADTYFADVDSTAWYYNYIAKAVEKEIVSGYPNDTFKPEANVSLAEALKITVNFLNVVPEARNVNITKIADISAQDWHAKYISTAIDENIIDLKTYLTPNKTITRAEAAAIIDKAFFNQKTDLVSWNYLTE